jgi:hypothetical protein
MPKSLPSDVVLTDDAIRLKHPVRYVRQVLGNMFDFKKEHGEVHLRLGTTGTGSAPHYRLQKDPTNAGASVGEIVAHLHDGSDAEYFSAFSGLNHKLIEWGKDELIISNWSKRSMSLDEVQQFLGELLRRSR